MYRSIKYALLLAGGLLISGCSLFHMYRPTIQQGNIISQDAVAQLKPGMTPDQVRYLMGTPMLTNAFAPDRWDYVYTIKKNGQPRQQQSVTLIFSNGVLSSIQTTPLVTVK